MKETKFCPHCGTPVEPDCNFCPNCGGSLGTTTADTNGFDANNASSNTSTYSSHEERGSITTDNGTLSLIFGILSFFILPIVFAILAIVFAGKCDRNDSHAKVGRVLGIISIIFWILMVVLFILVFFGVFTNGLSAHGAY